MIPNPRMKIIVEKKVIRIVERTICHFENQKIHFFKPDFIEWNICIECNKMKPQSIFRSPWMFTVIRSAAYSKFH